MMKVNRGKVHKYLGMTLDYTTVGQVKIAMLDYINETPYDFYKSYLTGVGTKSSAVPAVIFKFDKPVIFRVDKDCIKLNTNQAVEFHHLVGKVLFSTKQARPDTCSAVSFLTKIVREPDNFDW